MVFVPAYADNEEILVRLNVELKLTLLKVVGSSDEVTCNGESKKTSLQSSSKLKRILKTTVLLFFFNFEPIHSLKCVQIKVNFIS